MNLIAILASSLLVGGGGKVNWEKDYKKAVQEAKDSGGVMMLYFTQDG